jgi:hypothetical protein
MQRASFKFGGDVGNRTPDLLHAKQALYQLSYAPKAFKATRTIIPPQNQDLSNRALSQSVGLETAVTRSPMHIEDIAVVAA